MHSLTITRMTVFTVRLPVRSVRRQGTGSVANSILNVILKLETDAGITGWGEASPRPVVSGTVEGSVGALHVCLRPLIVGADAFRIEQIMDRAERTVVHCTEAKAALEMALFDIVGKALKTPVCNLLGGRVRDELPLSYSLADPDIDKDIETATNLMVDGHRIFKVKMGWAGHRADVARLEKMYAALPAGADIRLDYNQGLEPHDAIRKLREVERFSPTFIEQPVHRDQIDALAEITRAIDTPIMADESSPQPIDALNLVLRRAVDLISIKVAKCGGMLRGRRIAAIAEAGGIACYGGCMFETGIAHLAGTHLLASTQNISMGCEYYQATYYLQEDLLAAPFPAGNGKVVVPTSPGLGIDVDEDRVRKYLVDEFV